MDYTDYMGYPAEPINSANPIDSVNPVNSVDPVNSASAAGLAEAGNAVQSYDRIPLEDAEEIGWQEKALCAETDPDAFFPEKGGSTREAKKVCMGCEVRVECLDYALENDERFGIWGGLSERERRRLKKLTA